MSLYPRKSNFTGELIQRVFTLVPGVFGYFITPTLIELGSPDAAATDSILDSTVLSAGSTQTTFKGQPIYPRSLSITGVGGGATGDVVITGTNMLDEEIIEEIALSGTATVQGNKAFKTVTSIVLPPDSGATGEECSVGFGNKLGIPFLLPANTVFSAYLAGVRETTMPTVATDGSYIEGNTVLLDSALNGEQVTIILGV